MKGHWLVHVAVPGKHASELGEKKIKWIRTLLRYRDILYCFQKFSLNVQGTTRRAHIWHMYCPEGYSFARNDHPPRWPLVEQTDADQPTEKVQSTSLRLHRNTIYGVSVSMNSISSEQYHTIAIRPEGYHTIITRHQRYKTIATRYEDWMTTQI